MVRYRTLMACVAIAGLLGSTAAASAQTPPASSALGAKGNAGAPQPYRPPSAAAPAGATEAKPATPEAQSGGAAAAADPALAAAVANLPPQIEDVQIVGPWQEGSHHGIWRTVMMQVAQEGSPYRFFLQQVEEVDGKLSVKASTEIREIGQVKGSILSYRADQPSDDDQASLTLFFDIVPNGGEISETYELHFTPGGKYTFGPATN